MGLSNLDRSGAFGNPSESMEIARGSPLMPVPIWVPVPVPGPAVPEKMVVVMYSFTFINNSSVKSLLISMNDWQATPAISAILS